MVQLLEWNVAQLTESFSCTFVPEYLLAAMDVLLIAKGIADDEAERPAGTLEVLPTMEISAMADFMKIHSAGISGYAEKEGDIETCNIKAWIMV